MGEARARKLWSLSRLSLTPLPRQGSSRCLAPGTRFAALPSSPALRSGFGFSVQGSGFGDPTLGIRVQGPGIRDPGSGIRFSGSRDRYPVSGFRVSGSGIRVSSFGRFQRLLSRFGARVQGFRIRDSGSGFRDSGFSMPLSDFRLRSLRVVHLWRDKWTALSGPLSRHKRTTLRVRKRVLY